MMGFARAWCGLHQRGATLPNSNAKDHQQEDLTLFTQLRGNGLTNDLLLPFSSEFDPSIITLPYGNHQKLYKLSSKKKGSFGFGSFAENDKHDYDWLKTPPATPLFQSIEMEATAPQPLLPGNTAPIAQNLNETLLHQPLSRFVGGNNRRVEPTFKTSKVNAISNTASLQKPKLKSSRSPVKLASNTPASTSKNINRDPGHRTAQAVVPSRFKSSETKGVGRAVSPLVRSINKLDGFSNDAPPNLRVQPRSSSATRVPRGRGAADKASVATMPVETRSTPLIGSRMVEKMVNARKSAATSLNPAMITSTKSKYSPSNKLLTRSARVDT